MTDGGALLVDDRAGVRILTLSQPARRNALTPVMLGALVDAVTHVGDARAVVLIGEGAVFSAGFDLTAITEDVRAQGVDPIGDAAAAISACRVPVIAGVVGECHGGAVELCAACHVVVAAPSARFSIPAVRLGLVYPARGLVRLAARLGPAAARVAVTGAPFSSVDAARWGLVQELEEDATSRAHALAAACASAAPLAVAGTLAALRDIAAGAVDDIERHRAPALGSADLAEGIAAARARRPPTFTGR